MNIKSRCKSVFAAVVSLESEQVFCEDVTSADIVEAGNNVENEIESLERLWTAAIALEQYMAIGVESPGPFHTIALETIIAPLNIEVSLEGVGDTLRAIWDAIKVGLRALWKVMVDLFKQIKRFLNRTQRKIDDAILKAKAEQAAEKLSGLFSKRNISVNTMLSPTRHPPQSIPEALQNIDSLLTLTDKMVKNEEAGIQVYKTAMDKFKQASKNPKNDTNTIDDLANIINASQPNVPIDFYAGDIMVSTTGGSGVLESITAGMVGAGSHIRRNLCEVIAVDKRLDSKIVSADVVSIVGYLDKLKALAARQDKQIDLVIGKGEHDADKLNSALDSVMAEIEKSTSQEILITNFRKLSRTLQRLMTLNTTNLSRTTRASIKVITFLSMQLNTALNPNHKAV